MVGKRLLIGRKKMAGSVRLEAHVRTKTLDVGGGERREQTQLVEAGEGTLQPTIVADGARLVDVRMALELGERETVDVEALDVAGIDGEERKSLLGEVVNLEQLTGMGIATQTLAVSDNAAAPTARAVSTALTTFFELGKQ